MKKNRYRFLVSSKTFRKFLKQVVEGYLVDTLYFSIINGVLTVGECEIPIETREEGKFIISSQSIYRAIKALKHAEDQPIAVEYEETWNCFYIQCCF